MKQIELDLHHHDFFCPVTGEQIVGIQTPFEPSEATLFCFLDEIGEFQYAEEWIENLYNTYMEETDNDHADAFDKLLHAIGMKYDNTVCFSITTGGMACGPMSSTVHFGIDFDYAINHELALENDKLPTLESEVNDKSYSHKQTDSGLYHILSPEKEPLLDHRGETFPKLSENVSKNLAGDLNSIFEYNETHHNYGGGHNEELKKSFFYCVISTMQAYAKENALPQLEVTNQMQWDRLFRLSPGPPFNLFQLKATEKARDFLGDNWVDLPLNYSQSLEDMEHEDVEFVPEVTVKKIESSVKMMSPAELIMVNLLYNFFDYFSITIPVLWVSGKIGDEDFIAAYWALHREEDLYELNEEEYEFPRFLMNRLLFLKTLRYSYQWGDESLPTLL